MLRRRLLYEFMIIFCMFFVNLSGNTIYVDVNGTGDFTTIQEGINAASNGDTVLVADGIYTGSNNRNLTWNGNIKHLVVKSDNGAENCIINCEEEHGFDFDESHQDTTDVICGFTITNALAGVSCSCISITIKNNIIDNDNVDESCGICTYISHIIAINNSIINNQIGIIHYGGDDGSIIRKNNISNNSYIGFSCASIIGKVSDLQESVIIDSNSICNNSFMGIWCWNRSPQITNNNISYNRIAIICEQGACPLIQNNLISYNYGGYLGSGIVCFHECSYLSMPIIGGESGKGNTFYNNNGCPGADLYVWSVISTPITATYNTFDYFPVSQYYVAPIEAFDLEHSQGNSTLINQDVYVSPTGDNSNTGLIPYEPFQTIHYALSKVIGTSDNSITVHLAEGVYSPSNNDEHFPLGLLDFVLVIGENKNNTILDAENSNRIFYGHYADSLTISDLTVTNGYGHLHGGGIQIVHSNLIIENCMITNNEAYNCGGGIVSILGSPVIRNCEISNNIAQPGSGIYVSGSSDDNPIIKNNYIANNSVIAGPYDWGGGIFCTTDAIIENNIITENLALTGGGIVCYHCNAVVRNNVIDDNTASAGAGIYTEADEPLYVNNIVSNNSGYGIERDNQYPGNPIITYNDFWNNSYGNFHNCPDSLGLNVTTNANGNPCDIYYNIQLDPLFVDINNNDFHLTEYSFCIDAGNPDPMYFDPPDPDNPFFAQLPAMGTIINDMGAYGGPSVSGWIWTSIDDYDIPNSEISKFILYQNYPNPFSKSTTISFNLTSKSNKNTPLDSMHLTEQAQIRIYNIKGQLVKEFKIQNLKLKNHEVIWDGRDDSNRKLPNGIYLYKIETDNFSETKRMLLIR